jgi:hypothetical protein
MTATWKRLAIPGAMTALAATAIYSTGIASQNGQGGNAPSVTPVAPVVHQAPGKALGGVAHNLIGMNPGSGNVYLVRESDGSSTLLGTTQSLMSGMSRMPGTRDFYVSGGMTDGGNVYIAALGAGSVLLGNSGLGAIPGLAFDPADSTLYGTYTASVLADGLAELSSTTGLGTPIGAMGVGGLDALAVDPISGTMYASTGFFFDGSPGDVIEINKATGAATKTGVMSPQPPSTVAGMCFAPDGNAYISIGAGNGGVYSWDTGTNAITQINGAATLGAGSMSDLDVLR